MRGTRAACINEWGDGIRRSRTIMRGWRGLECGPTPMVPLGVCARCGDRSANLAYLALCFMTLDIARCLLAFGCFMTLGSGRFTSAST